MASPIALFVYNRPEHTRKTIEALQRNALASESVLYVFCDGPKETDDIEEINSISETRQLVKEVKGFKHVIVKSEGKNKGLARMIINGVSQVLSEFDRIIVLEDDIVVSNGFLDYMNDALNLYSKDQRVMHISGYWFPVRNSIKLPDTFFLQLATCWGWGTWSDAWQKFDSSFENLKKLEEDEALLRKFDLNDSGDFYAQLRDNQLQKIKTWAVFWYASIFFNDGLSLHPNQSFVDNIGHDGTGEHCYVTEKYKWPELRTHTLEGKIPESISQEALKYLVDFNRNLQDSGRLGGLRKYVKKWIG